MLNVIETYSQTFVEGYYRVWKAKKSSTTLVKLCFIIISTRRSLSNSLLFYSFQ